MTKVLCCKKDCNFNRLLSVSSPFTMYGAFNTTTFASTVVQYLQPNVAAHCRGQFPSLANALNASNPTGLATALASSPSIINFIYLIIRIDS